MGVEADILDLLCARLATLPVQTPPVEYAWPDVGFSPSVGVTYLEAVQLPADNRNQFIGDGSTTEFRGIFQVSIMSPLGKGLVAPLTIAGAVVEIFERSDSIPGTGVTVRIDGRPSIGPYLREPDRLRTPVRVRYYAFA